MKSGSSYVLCIAAAICFVLFSVGLVSQLEPKRNLTLHKLESSSIQYQWSAQWPDSSKWQEKREEKSVGDASAALWMKITLPNGAWKDPVLVFSPSVSDVIMYRNGTEWLRHTDMTRRDPRYLTEWSIFPLTEIGAKEVHLVQLPYPTVYPYSLQLSERADFVQYVFLNDLKLMVPMLLLLFGGLTAVGFYLTNRKEPLFLIFALFAFNQAVSFFVRMQSKHFLWEAPQSYFYLAVLSAVGWPVFLLMFFERIVHHAYQKLIRRAWQFYIALCFIVLLFIVLLPDSFPFINDIMTIPVQLLLLTITGTLLLSMRREWNPEYLFLLFGLVVYLLDFGFAVVSSNEDGGIAAMVALALTFSAILIRRYFLIQQRVHQLNTQLEQKVAERTQELEQTHSQLVESLRVNADYLAEVSALEERNRIAQEIHDVVGHTLTTAIIQMEAGSRFLAVDPDQAARRIETSQELVRKGLDDIRGSVRMLKKVDWSDSFTDSLEKLISNTELYAEVSIDRQIETLPELSPLQKNAIFYALQEGLTNGLRHGKSTRFQFSLGYEGKELTFRLENNGEPFLANEYGMGLGGIKNRLQPLNGTLRMYASAVGRGSVLDISFPLDH